MCLNENSAGDLPGRNSVEFISHQQDEVAIECTSRIKEQNYEAKIDGQNMQKWNYEGEHCFSFHTGNAHNPSAHNRKASSKHHHHDFNHHLFPYRHHYDPGVLDSRVFSQSLLFDLPITYASYIY